MGQMEDKEDQKLLKSVKDEKIVSLKIKLMEIRRNIWITRGKQIRYQQLEDVCYVNNVTNEEAINNLNMYLSNLMKVSVEMSQREEVTVKEVRANLKKYKTTVINYKKQQVRGKICYQEMALLLCLLIEIIYYFLLIYCI